MTIPPIPIPSLKDIYALAKHGLTIEAKEKIMQLREAAMALQEENLTLREKVKGLEEQARLSRDLKFDSHFYWLHQGESKEGPFCAVCYDGEKKLVRLHFGPIPSFGSCWQCYVCENHWS